MEVCSFTSLSHFQRFISLQRGVQIESTSRCQSTTWVKPWKCLFSNPCAFTKWVVPRSLHPCWLWDWWLLLPFLLLCKGELSTPKADLTAATCLRLLVCLGTLLTSACSLQHENNVCSWLCDPSDCMYRSYGIFSCLYNTCKRWKGRNFCIFG